MIQYQSVKLSNLLLVPNVSIVLDRTPLDPSYGSMIQSKMETGIFDACFENIIRSLWAQGK